VWEKKPAHQNNGSKTLSPNNYFKMTQWFFCSRIKNLGEAEAQKAIC
jgi:hypothetical protein